MCGRYSSVRSDDELLAEFDAIASQRPDWLTEPERAQVDRDYNVAPTKPIRVIVNRPSRGADGQHGGDPVRQLRVARWGLVPSWSKDAKGAARMINARAESITTTSAYRNAFARRRCLVPADGWYEWSAREGAGKQAYYLTPSDGHGLAFAGVYEFWGPPGHTLTTCAIVTTAATGQLAQIHERTPLVLPRDTWSRWLDPSLPDPVDLLAAWDEAAGERLDLRPVSSLVNKVDNQGPELIAPVEQAPAPQVLF